MSDRKTQLKILEEIQSLMDNLMINKIGRKKPEPTKAVTPEATIIELDAEPLETEEKSPKYCQFCGQPDNNIHSCE